MQDEFTTLQTKIVDVGLKYESFTPEGERKPISYYRVVLKCVINGNIEEMSFKPDKTQVMLLKSLAEVDSDVLELYQNNQEK